MAPLLFPVCLPEVQTVFGGRLVAIVRETRKSRHIGDVVHGVAPITPQVGQEIVLGEGMLFFRGYESVGVQPVNYRHTLWLDIEALYNVHEQTVTLFFDEITAD